MIPIPILILETICCSIVFGLFIVLPIRNSIYRHNQERIHQAKWDEEVWNYYQKLEARTQAGLSPPVPLPPPMGIGDPGNPYAHWPIFYPETKTRQQLEIQFKDKK